MKARKLKEAEASLEYLDGMGMEGYTFRKLVAHASVAFDHTPQQIVGPGRMQGPTRVRHAIMWVLRELGWSYPTIARLFVCDHTTVISANKRFQKALDEDQVWARTMRAELMAPGTVKGVTDTIETMQEQAKADIRAQRLVQEREAEVAELRSENEGLRIQVQALLKSVSEIGCDRDRYFEMKRHNAGRVAELRAELQNFKHEARPLLRAFWEERSRNPNAQAPADLIQLLTTFVQE